MLPLLDQLGLRALDERAFGFGFDGATVWLHDVGVAVPADVAVDRRASRPRCSGAFVAEFTGSIEVDGLNRLVLLAGLDARADRDRCAPTRATCARSGSRSASSTSRQRWPGMRRSAACSSRCSRRRFDPGDDRRRAEREPSCAPRSARRSTPCRASTTTARCGRSLRADRRDGAHQRLPTGRRRRPPPGARRSSSTPPRCPTCRCRGRCSRSGCARRGSRACTCAAGGSPAAASAGAIGARTSAPRSSA